MVNHLLMPSNDGVIPMVAFEDPELEEYIDCAATVLDIKFEPVVNKVVRTIVRGTTTKPYDIFGAGKDFVNKFVKDPEKVANATKALKWLRDRGIKPPRNSYLKFTENLLIDSLTGNKKMVELLSAQKTSNGALYAGNTIRKRKLAGIYGWMRHLQIQKGDVVQPSFVCPIAGFDNKISRLFRIIGYVSKGNIRSLSPDVMLRFIRGDKNLMRSLRPEEIINEISRSDVYHSEDVMLHVLIAMGLRQSDATKIIAKFHVEDNRFHMLTEAKLMSTNDQIVGQLDLSMLNLRRLIYIQPMGDSIVESMLFLLGFGYLITKYMETGEVRKLSISISDLGREEMMKRLTGKGQRYDGLRFMQTYNQPVDSDMVQ